MPRPLGITITTLLMCVTNAMGFFLINWKMPNAETLFVIFGFFITLGYIALWFFWKGRNWARWLVLLECIQCLWNLATLESPHRTLDPRVSIPMVLIEGAIAIFLLWYLNTKPIRTWFAENHY
jgi:hypothetical protein